MQDHIQRIEDKIQQLLKAYQQAQKEIERLQKENNRLTEHLASQVQRTDELDQQAATNFFNQNGMSEKSKRDLEKRINLYLKDIEKCLALLHS